MKHTLLFLLLLSSTLTSCAQRPEQKESSELIASVYGYDLTEDHFNTYLSFIEQQSGETSTLKTQIVLKSQLKEAFLNNPETILQELETLKNRLGDTEIKEEAIEIPTTKPIEKEVPSSLAEGHKLIHQILGDDIGQMQFDSADANAFRLYVANSLLTASTGSFEKSVGGSGTRRSNNRTQFCANGTYVEALSGSVGVDVEGGWVTGNGTTYINGYWDVATLPNGVIMILMYSTHPYVLEDWPNGFIPFVVAKHGVDFVALPSGDLYRRTANQYCN